jgi:hypothetical protein
MLPRSIMPPGYVGKAVGDEESVISGSLGSSVVLDAFATFEAGFVSEKKTMTPASAGVRHVLTQTFLTLYLREPRYKEGSSEHPLYIDTDWCQGVYSANDENRS